MTTETSNQSRPGDIITPRLQLVAWEITRSCNLYCSHCRASATHGQYSGELSTEECYRVIDEIVEVGKPIIILTGGEPLARQDVWQIAQYAVSKGLKAVMGSNGTLVTAEAAAKMKEIPISRLAISLDFPIDKLQDNFRGQAGAFEAALAGIANARQAGVELQINSTITKLNMPYLDELLALSLKVGAVAYHPFFLVPTGRGKGLEAVELSPDEYEQALNWIYEKQAELGDRIFFKPTDAPHYLRVVRQRDKQNGKIQAAPGGGHHPGHAISRGCLAGTGFCFISHRGKVQGCGYLDIEAGDIRKESFSQIWTNSSFFCQLRDLSNIKGKCGICEYKRICGGCRARAYETTGDCLEAEPYCIYQPVARPRDLTRVED
ncbi:MAG: radical SAM protein [Chloroflexi bacterium]|nr:radical SAM protein [Chloroflexota bacterium]